MHNERLKKLLLTNFFIDLQLIIPPAPKMHWYSKIISLVVKIAGFFSLPVIGFLGLLNLGVLKKNSNLGSSSWIGAVLENYFNGSNSLTSKLLNLNRILRRQKYLVDVSISIAKLAQKSEVSCLILPEDNNYYGTGLIINELHKIGIKVGVVDFTIGKEAEFKTSRHLLVPDKDSRFTALFARLFLNSSELNRWLRTREFVNCFPGSLETSFFSFLALGFESGLADFYTTSDSLELPDSAKFARGNSPLIVIEPIEFSLAKTNSEFRSVRDIFGVFLPPNQLTDEAVSRRMSLDPKTSYEQIIMSILNEAGKVCAEDERLFIFPHPRITQSHPQLLSRISQEMHIEGDFSAYLDRMKYALIFSSAVVMPLLASNVKVFNLDLYGYEYTNVFPTNNTNFVTISKIEDIISFSRVALIEDSDINHHRSTINEVLKSHLSV